MIMSLIVTLVYIIFMTGNLTILLKRNFEEVLPTSLMFSCLVLYIASFIGNLTIGFYCLVLLSFIFPIFILIKKGKNKNLKEIKEKFITTGFYLFLIIYFFVYLLNFKRGFVKWDEFSHWGPMVKEMLRLDTFYSDTNSMLSVHKDYPPAIILIEVLFCKFNQLVGKGYTESVIYRAFQIFILSCYLPAFTKQKITGNRLYKFCCLILLTIFLLAVQLIIPLGEAEIFSTIYIDGAMAVAFAYCIYLVSTIKEYDKAFFIQISITLSFLLLIKQIAIVLYLLTIAILALNICLNTELKISLKSKKNILYLSLCIFIIPYIFYKIWNLYIQQLGIIGQFSFSDINLSSFISIISDTYNETWRHTALVNFLEKFFNAKMKMSPLPLYFYQILLVLIVLFLIIGYINKDNEQRKQLIALNIMMFLGGLGYTFMMLLTYTYAFGEYEAVRTVCYNRYMGTYLFAFWSVIVMYFIYYILPKQNNLLKSSLILTAIFLIILVPTKNIKYLIPVIENNSAAIDLKMHEEIIKENTEEDAKIYMISQWNNGYDMFRMTYLTLPRKYNKTGYSLGEKYYDDDGWTKNLTYEKWVDDLKEYDYLYLKHIDEKFITKYGELFKGLPLSDGQLFKINLQDSNIKIQQVIP